MTPGARPPDPDADVANRSDADDDGRPDDWPDADCDYCERTEPKRRSVRRLDGRVRWKLPKGWRELPNGLTECDGCRPVPNAETGRLERPARELRG